MQRKIGAFKGGKAKWSFRRQNAIGKVQARYFEVKMQEAIYD